jgi:lipoprotein-releasing system permease protein
MIVLQKTRDIGIIKSIGASSGGVAAIFIAYGAAIGVVGSLIGATLGYWFVVNINDVQDFLIWAFNFRVWDRSVYSFDEIPHEVRAADLIGVVLVAIVTSTLGSLLAAWRAGAMNPVEALRHE